MRTQEGGQEGRGARGAGGGPCRAALHLTVCKVTALSLFPSLSLRNSCLLNAPAMPMGSGTSALQPCVPCTPTLTDTLPPAPVSMCTPPPIRQEPFATVSNETMIQQLAPLEKALTAARNDAKETVMALQQVWGRQSVDLWSVGWKRVT